MAAMRRVAMRAGRNLSLRSPSIVSNIRQAPTAASQQAPQAVWSRIPSLSTRQYASDSSPSPVEPPDFLDERELKIFNMLKEALQPESLEVQDVSGGCGSMYALDITSKQFKGLPMLKQHRLVSKVLEEEIKKWHGVQMKTRAP